MDDRDWDELGAALDRKAAQRDELLTILAKIGPAVAVLHCSIAALEGPEYLSRERRAEIGLQLRAMVEFIEQLGEHLA